MKTKCHKMYHDQFSRPIREKQNFMMLPFFNLTMFCVFPSAAEMTTFVSQILTMELRIKRMKQGEYGHQKLLTNLQSQND